ncbi:MAG: putative nucleic acid-binding Zn ribbon protein [Cyclobacteriaceae bacterium]|jgi:predicted nucleic acid-binding Zn ribbon protein
MDSRSPQLCLQCSKAITGRADKKFCDAYCRNAYNNQHKAEDEVYIQVINKQIRKNRRILKTLCPHGKATVRKDLLDHMGYDFRVFTGQYQSDKGGIYYLCYDYGLTIIMDNGKRKALIVQRQPYMDTYSPV